MSPKTSNGGEASPLAPASSPEAAGSSATPLSGAVPRNSPDFKIVALKELAAPIRNAIVGGPFGSNLVSKDYVESGVPVIRGQNMTSGKWIGGEFAFVSPVKAKSLSQNIARPGDLVFTQRGTLGQVAIVPAGGYPEYVVSQSQMKITVDGALADSHYLYYVFSDEQMQGYIRANAIQVGVPHTNLGILKETPVPLPPISVQRSIAHILGTLDDKIELNRCINQTLEEMAQALFKSWFVDFDPVKAKASVLEAGGTPQQAEQAAMQSISGKSSEELESFKAAQPDAYADLANTASLFPSRLTEIELGQIPEGWETGSILQIASLLSGGTPKTSEPSFWDGDVAWASAKDVSQCSDAFLVNTERTITQVGLEKSTTRLIPAFATAIVARGATTGRMTICGREMAMNQTCYALQSKIGTPFSLYCHARQFMDEMVHSAHGAIFDTITTSTFATTRVVLPGSDLLKAFNEAASPVFAGMLTRILDTESIQKARDSLLPKLLSGELEIPDELLAEAAA